MTERVATPGQDGMSPSLPDFGPISVKGVDWGLQTEKHRKIVGI